MLLRKRGALFVPAPYAGGGGGGGLAFDGSAFSTTDVSPSLTITTTQPNDIIVLWGFCNSGADDPGTGAIGGTAGLTWTKQGTTANQMAVFTALAASALSGATISMSIGGGAWLGACAVAGAKTSGYLDGSVVRGASLPASITTANANDFILTMCGGGGAFTADSGWSLLHAPSSWPPGYTDAEYRIASSAGTYSNPFGSSTGTWAAIAIEQGP
jgi:hypothetical protein